MGEPINLFIKNAKKDEDTIFVEDAPHVPPTAAFVPDVQIESAGVDYIKEDPRTTFERLSEKASEFGGLRNVQDIVNFIDWGVKTLTPSNLANLALGRETSDKSPVFPQASYETMHPDQQKIYNMVSIAEMFVSGKGALRFLNKGKAAKKGVEFPSLADFQVVWDTVGLAKLKKAGYKSTEMGKWEKAKNKAQEMLDLKKAKHQAKIAMEDWDDVMEAEIKQLRLMEGTLDEKAKAQEMLNYKKAKHQVKIAMDLLEKENPLFAKFTKRLKGEKTGLASVIPVLESEKPKKVEDNIIDYMQESDYFTF